MVVWALNGMETFQDSNAPGSGVRGPVLHIGECRACQRRHCVLS